MLKNPGAAVALMALLVLGGYAGFSQNPPPQTPQIDVHQETQGAVDGKHSSERDPSNSNQMLLPNPPTTTEGGAEICDSECQRRAEERSEYWFIFGRRLKITDTVLAVFTGLLFIVGTIQSLLLAKTVSDTGIAAQAAKTSAEALPNIERAYLFARVSDWAGDADQHYFDGTSGSSAPIHAGRFYARYFFANYGKTPAVIHEIRVGTKRSAEPLDPTEWAECPNILPAERVIAGTVGETPVYDIRHPSSENEWLSLGEGDAFAAGALFIYFYGCATYSDIFGETHETQFCFRYDRDGFTQRGGRQHNRRT